MSFIARCLHIPGICFVTEATAVQQNDSDRTKNTDNKNKNEKEQVIRNNSTHYGVNTNAVTPTRRSRLSLSNIHVRRAGM